MMPVFFFAGAMVSIAIDTAFSESMPPWARWLILRPLELVLALAIMFGLGYAAYVLPERWSALDWVRLASVTLWAVACVACVRKYRNIQREGRERP